MMQLKKLLSAAFAGLMLVSFTACSGATKPEETKNLDVPETATVAPEMSALPEEESSTGGVLTMGLNASFPPYEYYEGSDIAGIDPEIGAAIADKLGMELEIQDMQFKNVLMSVQSGKIDMGMSGISVTEDRKETMDFSDPYAKGIQAMIVLEGSEIQSKEDLAGKKVGVQLATTGDICVTGDFGEDVVERFNTGADAVMNLKGGKIDCVVIDLEPAKVYVEQNEGLKLLESTYVEEEYAIAFKKGNAELQKKVNDALKELIADGTVQAIIDKYIKAD